MKITPIFLKQYFDDIFHISQEFHVFNVYFQSTPVVSDDDTTPKGKKVGVYLFMMFIAMDMVAYLLYGMLGKYIVDKLI